MPSMQQVTARITEAQDAINAELKNVAAALGQPAPKLKQPYAATQYEQIAVHLESVRDALAKMNQGAAEEATEEAEEAEEAEGGQASPESVTPEQPAAPTTSTRRGKPAAVPAEPEA